MGGILSSVITNDRDASISILVGANLVALLVSTFVAACTTNIELKNVLHEKTDFNRVLSAAANRYLGFLGMTIMLYVLLTLCALAFLVPLFIVGPRVSLAQYFGKRPAGMLVRCGVSSACAFCTPSLPSPSLASLSLSTCSLCLVLHPHCSICG